MRDGQRLGRMRDRPHGMQVRIDSRRLRQRRAAILERVLDQVETGIAAAHEVRVAEQMARIVAHDLQKARVVAGGRVRPRLRPAGQNLEPPDDRFGQDLDAGAVRIMRKARAGQRRHPHLAALDDRGVVAVQDLRLGQTATDEHLAHAMRRADPVPDAGGDQPLVRVVLRRRVVVDERQGDRLQLGRHGGQRVAQLAFRQADELVSVQAAHPVGRSRGGDPIQHRVVQVLAKGDGVDLQQVDAAGRVAQGAQDLDRAVMAAIVEKDVMVDEVGGVAGKRLDDVDLVEHPGDGDQSHAGLTPPTWACQARQGKARGHQR